MKIFAVARNYGPMAGGLDGRELSDAPMGDGAEALIYEMPDSSIVRTRQPFFVPDFAGETRLMPTLVLRIGKLGKGIASRFADRYFDGRTMGCAAVATDMLRALRREGLPWFPAISFDKACMLGDFRGMDEPMPALFEMTCGADTLRYDTEMIRHSAGEVLQKLSRDITVKSGDMILLALHPLGLPARIGDKLTIAAVTDNNDDNDNNEQHPLLEINIR